MKMEITSERITINALQVDKQKMTRLVFRQIEQVPWPALDLDILGFDDDKKLLIIATDYYVFGEFYGYVDLRGDSSSVWLVYQRGGKVYEEVEGINTLCLKRTLIPAKYVQRIKKCFNQIFIGT